MSKEQEESVEWVQSIILAKLKTKSSAIITIYTHSGGITRLDVTEKKYPPKRKTYDQRNSVSMEG